MTEGEFLKKARIDAGLTQTELAKKMGWGNCQFCSNQERNIASLPNRSIKRFIKITRCNAKEFFLVKLENYANEINGFFP